ncbi:histidine kinase [Polymorphobacter glacialis]|uniref:histidine kinase n=1 Tax=Sandarakinorhabdus glacialis TaxID=1614636 RepID=A0A917E8D0_9SPHN|nr:PAS domain-containing sensor histidine kinase [Polymorphobacter glacialis]GGE14950.1 histidine kinase [Polymorphobacter glacialis]
MSAPMRLPAALRFLAGDGEMARRIRAFDWAAHPLGEPSGWPQALKLSVRIMLTTQHPVFVFWGADSWCFYNDSYARSLGPEKHPAMLGEEGALVWQEVWHAIGPQIETVMSAQGATWYENQRLPIFRHGSLQDVFWTYSYGPIDDDTAPAGVGGVLVLVTETTAQMQAGHEQARVIDRLQALFDQAPGFMCVMTGPEHVFEVANAAFRELVGRSEIIGQPVREAIPELIEQGFIERLQQVFRTGERMVAEHLPVVLQRRAGEPAEERFLNFIYEPIVGADGSVTGIFCEGSDVTARHVAERALRESDTRFRNMADSAPIMMWETDPTGNCTYLNSRWYEYTGQSEADALGLGWTLAVHPDEQVEAERVFMTANKARGPFRIEYRVKGADGQYRWMIDAATPRLADDGAFVGFVGSVIDIDDRKRAEDGIRISEGRFRAAVEAIQGYLWTNDVEGRMTGRQPGWAALTGQSEAEYQGYGWVDAVHPDDAEATLGAWRAAVDEQRRFNHEHRVRRSDGSWGRFAICAIPIVEGAGARPGALSSESGQPVAKWVGVHTDVTEQRRTEDALKELNHTLEDRIAAELARRSRVEAALRQRQKMEAIGVLTSGLAHDFNNMLTVIISGLSILERTMVRDPGKAKVYIDAASDGARRAAALVDRLMDFARQKPLELAPVEVNALIDGMSEILRRSVGDAVALEVTLEAGLWSVETDVSMLENVVLNLAMNARDAMPGGGRLAIRSENVAVDAAMAAVLDVLPGDYVMVGVTDTGSGMTPDVVERAFNPFFTTKAVGKGTGLGLSQVHGFAKQSGGTAVIASTSSAGTEICVYLPRVG